MITAFTTECVLFKFHAGDTPVGKEFEKDGFAFLPGSIKNSWIVRLPGNGGTRLPGNYRKQEPGPTGKIPYLFSALDEHSSFWTILSDKLPQYPSINFLTLFFLAG